MHHTKSLAVLFFVLLGLAAPALAQMPPQDCKPTWRAKLAEKLPVFGHRNWIVVADSAYPAQSRPGIETVYAGGDQLKAVKEVLDAVEKAQHVRPIIYVDAELKAVPDTDAPGVDAYRKKLDKLLAGKPVKTMPHEEIIGELDEAAKMFNILIIKTDLTIPYTSVFFQLDCGYWSGEKEERMRKAIEKEK